MRLPVRAGDPRTVNAERDRQILSADIVNNFIEGALQKGGIDGIIRAHPLRRKRSGEHRGMLLADPDVVRPLGEFVEEGTQTERIRHCSRDSNDSLVLFRHGNELFPQRRGVFRLRLGGRDPVRSARLLLTKRISLSLSRRDMQKHAV